MWCMKGKTPKLTAVNILKTKGILYFSPEQKLSEALSQFKSSHDAVIVVDEKKRLLGVVSPYYAVIKRYYPPQTKLKHCLFHPPKIFLDTALDTAVRLMLESKIHYLPVRDIENRVLGIVTARRALKKGLRMEKSNHLIETILKNKSFLQSVNEQIDFNEVIRFFQTSKLSKLVVVNKENHLQGIISYFDLLPLFAEPKERKHFLDKSGEKLFKNYKISQFIKRYTIKVSPKASLKEIIKLILDKEIGSVIVMRNGLEPQNIITTSDLLKYLYL